MVDFLQMLKELPDVVLESSRSRERRNAGAHRLITPPPAGTPLLVSLALAFEHTGVYLGGNRVLELNGEGYVKDVSLTQFINGTSDGTSLIRNGTRIFAACDARTRRPLASKRTLETARAVIEAGVPRLGYDVAQFNCHLFTAACIRGVLPGERRFPLSLGGGVASVGKLERLLSKTLNHGKEICWCGVRRDKELFRYSLSPEKKNQLVAADACKNLFGYG